MLNNPSAGAQIDTNNVFGVASDAATTNAATTNATTSTSKTPKRLKPKLLKALPNTSSIARKRDKKVAAKNQESDAVK